MLTVGAASFICRHDLVFPGIKSGGNLVKVGNIFDLNHPSDL